jgi:sec-independent protein translocase protein TatC
MCPDDHPDNHSMSFGDHLEELRRRILWAVAAPLPLSVVTFIFSDPLIEWLYRPLDRVLEAFELPRRLQALGPAEVLVTKIKLSLIAAIVLSAPWIFWQAWRFVRPGLYRQEQRFVYFLVPGSAILTATGLALMYFAMLPLMLQVLVMFGTSLSPGPAGRFDDPRVEAVIAAKPALELRWLKWPELDLYVALEVRNDAPPTSAGAAAGNGVAGDDPANPAPIEFIRVPQPGGSMVSQEFRLTTYLNFVLLLMLGIVIAFQMPLVIVLLGWLGLVTAPQLRAKRKYAIFICAVTAAVITPADALSMIMMLIPLYALYELSIVALIFAPASAVAEGTLWRRLSLRRSPRRPGQG